MSEEAPQRRFDVHRCRRMAKEAALLTEPVESPAPEVPKKSHHRIKRPYKKSGLYRFVLHPDDQAIIDEVRSALTADCGGQENLSAARRLLIDLAAAAMRCRRVNSYLATLPSLIDRQRSGIVSRLPRTSRPRPWSR
jgi:hypothetical protein